MNKSDAIKQILSKIYSCDTTLILGKRDTKLVNNYYKNNFNKYKDFTQFLTSNSDINGIVVKLKSGEKEIQKQFENSLGLQPGILSECNYIETLAKIFHLNKCVDLDTTPTNQLPKSCVPFIKSGANTFSCSRYLYFSTKNNDVFIFQYGNPAAGDAEIIFFKTKVFLEVKERTAKCGEFDLKYDEEGKLIPSDKVKKEFPEMIGLIEAFNSETSVFEQIGSNYNRFDKKIVDQIIKSYFNKPQIDLLISTDINDQLIALQPQNINIVLPNGKKIIETNTSEIRTSGRNHGPVFTPLFLNKTLDAFDATEIEPGKYMIVNRNNKDVGFVKARGKDVISRFKINHIFFIPYECITQKGEYVIFNKKDIKQLKASISMHMCITAEKNEIGLELEKAE